MPSPQTRSKRILHGSAYVATAAFLIAIVAVGYQPPAPASGSVASQAANTPAPTVATGDMDASVDTIIATDVTASLSEQANLPIAPSVANMSVSLAAKSELAQTDDAVIAKPQIIQPAATNRAITTYTSVKGDTVQKVAQKTGLSEDTIRWANNLERDSIEKGRELKILPVDGMHYKVKDGESVSDLADRFSTDASRIIAFNDLEISRPTPGQMLIIPDGEKPETRPVPQQQTAQPSNSTTSGGNLGGAVVRDTGISGASAGNRYAPGNCTWYVYERMKQLGTTIGSFWGNANTWASSARAAGFTVNGSPAPGTILVDTAGYYGHVAVVESVKSNGDLYITEMNNYAYGGFNIVNDRTISAGQASAYQYIHP